MKYYVTDPNGEKHLGYDDEGPFFGFKPENGRWVACSWKPTTGEFAGAMEKAILETVDAAAQLEVYEGVTGRVYLNGVFLSSPARAYALGKLRESLLAYEAAKTRLEFFRSLAPKWGLTATSIGWWDGWHGTR